MHLGKLLVNKLIHQIILAVNISLYLWMVLQNKKHLFRIKLINITNYELIEFFSLNQYLKRSKHKQA